MTPNYSRSPNQISDDDDGDASNQNSKKSHS